MSRHVKPIIAIPYRGVDDARRRNFDLVMQQVLELWTTAGIRWGVDDSGDQPFSIARTWNKLAKQATWRYPDWTHLIRWAADFIIDDPQRILAAIETMDANGWAHVLPFDQATKLTETETNTYAETGQLPTRTNRLPFGGINITTREAWDRLGGFDETFKGWGHEDREYVHRLEAAFGPRHRTPGHMFILHHPKNVPGDPYWEARHANRKRLEERTQ